MTKTLRPSQRHPAPLTGHKKRRRWAVVASRMAGMLAFSGIAALSQTSESQYVSDLTSAIASIFNTNIALAGTPLPRVKFSAHDLPADGAYIGTFITAIQANCPATSSTSYTTWTSTCLLKAYTDGLVRAGVDRIEINTWTAPYVDGNTPVKLIYANLVNYIHAQLCNGHACEVELNPADKTLSEIETPSGPCATINDMNDYLTCLTVTTTAMVAMATDPNYTQQPEHFTIVHECSTQNTRFSWNGVTAGQGTASDWRGFVDAVAAALKGASPSYTGKVGAGGCLYWEDGTTVVGGNAVPNFCGDAMYGFNGDSANLQYITYDLYNAQSTTGPSTYAANMTSRSAGNYADEIAATVAAGWADVRVEESGRPPFVYTFGGNILTDIEPNTTADSYLGCGWSDWDTYGLDRQWLDMIAKFASGQKMTSVAAFYTFPFFAYTSSPADQHEDCNPAALYTVDVVSNSLAFTSATGTYFNSLSTKWPTVLATGSVRLTGTVKLQ